MGRQQSAVRTLPAAGIHFVEPMISREQTMGEIARNLLISTLIK
jgi:hypothetical protein